MWHYLVPEMQVAVNTSQNLVKSEASANSNTVFCTNNLQAIFFQGNNSPPSSPALTAWVQWLALYKACPGKAKTRHRHIKAWKEQLQVSPNGQKCRANQRIFVSDLHFPWINKVLRRFSGPQSPFRKDNRKPGAGQRPVLPGQEQIWKVSVLLS